MKKETLDDIQLALDVAGIEPTIGIAADATNTIISLLRAAKDKEKDERNKHLIDAGISAISMIPFADVVKLLKLRKLRKPAVKIARTVKTVAKDMPKSYTGTDDIGEVVNEMWIGWEEQQNKTVPIKPNEYSREDQIEDLIAKAWKKGDAEAYVYYTLSYGKTLDPESFEQFKGSSVYEYWKQKPEVIKAISDVEKEMKRFNCMRTKEGYGGIPGKDKAFVKGHRWTVKWKQEEKLKEIIRECICEVIKEGIPFDSSKFTEFDRSVDDKYDKEKQDRIKASFTAINKLDDPTTKLFMKKDFGKGKKISEIDNQPIGISSDKLKHDVCPKCKSRVTVLKSTKPIKWLCSKCNFEWESTDKVVK